MSSGHFRSRISVSFHHPVAFWLGTAAVIGGVLGHLPMFLASREMGYRMVGMEMETAMTVGMYAILVGTAVVFYALLPPRAFRSRLRSEVRASSVQALDDAVLTPTHWKLFVVLVVALIVDVMKPATLGFVVPGTAAEYGLSRSEVALLPLAGILGTTMGSFLWGWLGDTIGRRASILLAAVLFIGTSICGAMPSFRWNIFMCWLMGLGAGGMLPITFALLAEIVPARHRGWLIVLFGGIGTVGGYLAASGLAAVLMPIYGWRIMWFLGLPTGVILLLLNRYIPESPRFLLAEGESEEAHRVMRSFGVTVVAAEPQVQQVASVRERETGVRSSGLAEIFRLPYMGLTLSLGVFGLAWGLVNFGFLLWLPLNLRQIGMGAGASDAILAKSAIIAFPVTLIGAWSYHKWSSKGTMVLFALLTAVTLVGFAIVGGELAEHPFVMNTLLVSLLASSSGVIAMLSPYTAEVYPVHIRATGSGWSAGCSKGAGVLTLGAAAAVGLTPGITAAALVAAVATVLASAAIAWKGVETKGLGLEVIQEKRSRTAEGIQTH